MRTVFQLSSLHAGDWLGRSPKPLSGAEDPVSGHTHPLFMLLSLIPASAPAKRSPALKAAAAGPQPVVGGLRVEPVRAAGERAGRCSGVGPAGPEGLCTCPGRGVMQDPGPFLALVPLPQGISVSHMI